MLYAAGGLTLFAFWIFCVIDVITTDEYRMRNMPKSAWVLAVVFLPTVGSIAWLVAGRPWDTLPGPAPTGVSRDFPEYDRSGRHVAQNPEDDEAFLRRLRARAQEQRQRAAEERRRREEQGLD